MTVLTKKLCALTLAFSLFLTPLASLRAQEPTIVNFSGQSFEQLITQPDTVITRGQFAMLINAFFSFYSPGLESIGTNFLDVPSNHPYALDLLCAKIYGYMIGDGTGNVYPDALITGVEAVTVINNLLGFDASKIEQVSGLSVPEWAVPSASVLLDLGIVDKNFIIKNQVTVNDAIELLTAFSVAASFAGSPYALSQARLEDDFYAYINRQYLATATIPPGNIYAMTFLDTEMTVEGQLSEIIGGILNSGSLVENSDEWKIKQLYEMYLDNDARTASLSLLKPYFDEINAVASIEELIGLSRKYINYFNLFPFYSMATQKDAATDATKWAVFVLPAPLDLGTRDYYMDSENLYPVQAAYRDYIKKILNYIGETNNIDERVNDLYNMEKSRAMLEFPAGSYSDPNVLYTQTSWEEMLDVTSASQALLHSEEVYELIKDFNIYCPNMDYVKFAESLYVEENLQALKDYALLNVFSSLAQMLGDDILTFGEDLQLAMYGQAIGTTPVEKRAETFVTGMMSKSLSNMYASAFSSEQKKKDMIEIVESIRAEFRERILTVDWMSEETRTEAVAKLDAVTAYVAYPDKPLEGMTFDLKAKENGGSLIDVYFNLCESSYNKSLELLQKPAVYNLWDSIPTYTVNAFYSPADNAIIIPSGILQDSFYDPEASREQNLGAIGAIIAHEFTHAFDSNGAQYDKDGTLTNWWITEDYMAFSELAYVLASELSEIELFDGMYVNGLLCTAETIADLGAIACVLGIAADMENADLEALMESWSAVWAARMSAEVAAYLLSIDSHAPHKVRVNFILSQINEFYETYGVTESDGMYITLEDRISIW